MNAWKFLHRPQAAMVLLRVTLAVLMLFHGWAKIVHGTSAIESLLQAQGLPTLLAWGVYLGEVAAPLLLLLGVFVVPAALVIAVNMVFALFLAHMDHVARLTTSGGWAIELQVLLLVCALVIAMSAGRGTGMR